MRRNNHLSSADEYINGNTIYRGFEEDDDDFEPVYREISGRKHVRDKRLGRIYMAFTCAALVAMSAVLVWYVSVRSELTNGVKEISALESELNDLKQSNDEAYNRANSNVNLDEVKRIAVEEYGMQYAQENQIVRYSDQGGDDYVRQKAQIPQK